MVSYESEPEPEDTYCNPEFLVFELIIANIPMLYFIIAGYINFR